MHSSISEMKSFMKSNVATDLKRELACWIRNVKMLYPEVDSLLEKGRIDGRVEAISFVLSLPEVMLDSLIEIQEEKRKMKEEEHVKRTEDSD